MKPFDQKKYDKYRIEKSPYTLASDGCLISSLASIHTKFYPDAGMDPVKMMALLEPIIGDKTGVMVIGNLKRDLAKKVGFEYVTRSWKNIPAEYSKHANNPDQAVIIEVDVNRLNNIKTDQHFVAVSSCADGLEIMDPLGGKFKRGIPSPYLFKSYIVFNKLDSPKPVVSDWAKEAVEWAKTKGIKDWTQPQSLPDNYTAAEMLHRTGHLKEGERFTKEQLALILYRIENFIAHTEKAP